jgi:hypothetical protein
MMMTSKSANVAVRDNCGLADGAADGGIIPECPNPAVPGRRDFADVNVIPKSADFILFRKYDFAKETVPAA